MGPELESAAMADEGPNPELVDFTRRFRVGAALTLPLLVLAMGPSWAWEACVRPSANAERCSMVAVLAPGIFPGRLPPHAEASLTRARALGNGIGHRGRSR